MVVQLSDSIMLYGHEHHTSTVSNETQLFAYLHEDIETIFEFIKRNPELIEGLKLNVPEFWRNLDMEHYSDEWEIWFQTPVPWLEFGLSFVNLGDDAEIGDAPGDE